MNEVITALANAQGRLFGYIYLQLGQREVARDVLQETNLYIWKNIAHLDAPEHFWPWAKTLASFQVRRYIKDRTNERKAIVFDSPTADTLAEKLSAPPSEDPSELSIEALESCLGKLPPDKRDLVNRRYWNRRSLNQIAREDSLPLSTVAMRFLRIREELTDCIRHFFCHFGEESAAKPGESSRAELLETAFDGDGASLRKLAGQLAGDPSLRSEWLTYGALHAALSFNRERLKLTVQKPAAAPRVRRVLQGGAAAAALVLFAGVLAYAYSVVMDRSGNQPMVSVPETEAIAPVSAEPLAPIESNRLEPAGLAAAVTTTHTAFAAAAIPATLRKEEEGETNINMKTNTLTRGVAAAVATVAVAVAPPLAQTASATDSLSGATRMVVGSPMESIYWQTAFTNCVPICWKACPQAVSARLTVACLNAEPSYETYYPAETNAVWILPANSDEELYRLVLQYRDEDGEPLLTVTSRVARVKGANGTGGVMDFATDESTDTEITPWNKVRRPGANTDNAVIAFDAAWNTTNAVGSAVFTATPRSVSSQSRVQELNAASGYFGWQFTGQNLPVGWYRVSLEFDDDTILTQNVYRSPSGTLYSFQ